MGTSVITGAGSTLWKCSLGSQATDDLLFIMKATHTLYTKPLKHREVEIGNKTPTAVLSRLPPRIIKRHGFLYVCLNAYSGSFIIHS